MESTYKVDFGKPIALFPLPAVVLLPHGIQPLHIFEPRYVQMVDRCLASGNGRLDAADPIAMAVIDDDKYNPVGPTSLKSAVCVGRIKHHVALPDGRHNIFLEGVCRARIDEIDEPWGDRLHRRGWLRPVEKPHSELPPMLEIRESLRELLAGPRLSRMTVAAAVIDCIERDDVPTSILLELIGFTSLLDDAIRYRLLSEGNCHRRANLVEHELRILDGLMVKVDEQRPDRWPKGLSFN